MPGNKVACIWRLGRQDMECLFLLSIHFPLVNNILLSIGKLSIPLLAVLVVQMAGPLLILPLSLWMESAPGLTPLINTTSSWSQSQTQGWTCDSVSASETQFQDSCETGKKLESLLSTRVARRSCISLLASWSKSLLDNGSKRWKGRNKKEQTQEPTTYYLSLSKFLLPARSWTLSIKYVCCISLFKWVFWTLQLEGTQTNAKISKCSGVRQNCASSMMPSF